MKTLRLGLMGLLVLVHTAVLGNAPELPYGRVSVTTVNATHATASGTSESVLDLNRSHLWVDLRVLKRELVAGEEFPIELVSGTFRLNALAHVHEG